MGRLDWVLGSGLYTWIYRYVLFARYSLAWLFVAQVAVLLLYTNGATIDKQDNACTMVGRGARVGQHLLAGIYSLLCPLNELIIHL